MIQLYDQHQMAGKEEWLINFQGKAINFFEINRNPLAKREEEEAVTFGEVELNDQMKENKLKEAKYITNYFLIADITTYIQTLTAMTKITQIDPRKLANKLEMHKFKMPTPEEENVNALQTNRAKVEACFSRRWRQVQVTIYLLFHNFVTPEKTTKMRVIILNQRGLILQILSNVNPEKCYLTVAKNLKSSYSRLKNLVILSHSERYADLDCLNAFKDTLSTVNVLLVSYSSRQKLEAMAPSHLSSAQACSVDLLSGLRLSEYNRQWLYIWHRQSFKQQYLNYFISNLLIILQRQRKVQLFFKEYPYNHHQFNQKQFLLRLFSFYFNSITLEKMDDWDNAHIKDTLLNTCTEQLMDKQKEQLAKNGDREVHTFTTNSTSLLCPVCKKKSKIVCLKCSGEFGTKFGLCEISCFQKFHEDRIRYAHEISNRRKICDFSIQNKTEKRQNEEESDDEAESDDNGKAPSIIQAKSYQEVLEKWGNAYEKQQKELDQFMKLSSMNFIAKGFVDRIKLLQNKIGQLSLVIEEKRIKVKQQE